MVDDREIPMTAYRLYFMCPATGDIQGSKRFEAEDDASAMAAASDYVGLEAVELGRGHRKLSRIEGVLPLDLRFGMAIGTPTLGGTTRSAAASR